MSITAPDTADEISVNSMATAVASHNISVLAWLDLKEIMLIIYGRISSLSIITNFPES